jgi:hypothetical protein
MLSATLTVVAGTGRSGCTPLHSGASVTLHVGDRVEFLANGAPRLMPAGSRAVRVTTAPARLRPGPGAPDGNLGVLVAVAALRPGRVQLQWISCSGTFC